jgi:acetyl-CoA acetyltransferase
VNRLCGSGLQAVVSAAQMIRLGESRVAIAGGTENMTQAPHVIRGARTGLRLGEGKLEDSLMVALLDTQCGLAMAQTSDNLARQRGITRDDMDAYALRSQQAAAAAAGRGVFREEIVPVVVTRGKKSTRVEADDHPRPTPRSRPGCSPARVRQGRLRHRYAQRDRRQGSGAGRGVGDPPPGPRGAGPVVSWAAVGVAGSWA